MSSLSSLFRRCFPEFASTPSSKGDATPQRSSSHVVSRRKWLCRALSYGISLGLSGGLSGGLSWSLSGGLSWSLSGGLSWSLSGGLSGGLSCTCLKLENFTTFHRVGLSFFNCICQDCLLVCIWTCSPLPPPNICFCMFTVRSPTFATVTCLLVNLQFTFVSCSGFVRFPRKYRKNAWRSDFGSK